MTKTKMPSPLPKASLQQRMAARANACGGSYEEFLRGRKQALFKNLHGNILEIGPGAGPNLEYFPADAHWKGIEPNPATVPYLEETIRSLGRPVENYTIELGDPRGERLPVDDASQDAVVSTLVLCSVRQPEKMLHEIQRVLKPGGEFVFIEHVAAPRGTGMRTLQDVFTPLSILFEDGCHPNRETWVSIANAGFEHVEIEHFKRQMGAVYVPFIAGRAIKGAG